MSSKINIKGDEPGVAEEQSGPFMPLKLSSEPAKRILPLSRIGELRVTGSN
jgi:hypothetical protein